MVLHVSETADQVLRLALNAGGHGLQALSEVSVQVLHVDPECVEQSEFVLNVTEPRLHHLPAGLYFVLDVVNEVRSSVYGGGYLGVAALYLRPDRAEGFLVLSPGFSDVGRNRLQGIVTVMDRIS